jgi:hypothetical protein
MTVDGKAVLGLGVGEGARRVGANRRRPWGGGSWGSGGGVGREGRVDGDAASLRDVAPQILRPAVGVGCGADWGRHVLVGVGHGIQKTSGVCEVA